VKTTPTRTRWAKERLGLVGATTATTAAVKATTPPPGPPTPREAYVLSVLMDSAGGSYAQRQRAIDKVRGWGWSDEEISTALDDENRRLEAARNLLRARLNHITVGEDLPEGTPLSIADESGPWQLVTEADYDPNTGPIGTNIADTCCGKCTGDTCCVDQITGA